MSSYPYKSIVPINRNDINRLSQIINSNCDINKYFHDIEFNNNNNDIIKIIFTNQLSFDKRKLLNKIVYDFLFDFEFELDAKLMANREANKIHSQHPLIVYNLSSDTVYCCILTLIKPKCRKFDQLSFISNITNDTGISYSVEVYNVSANKMMIKKDYTNMDEKICTITQFCHNVRDPCDSIIEICVKTTPDTIIQFKNIYAIFI